MFSTIGVYYVRKKSVELGAFPLRDTELGLLSGLRPSDGTYLSVF